MALNREQPMRPFLDELADAFEAYEVPDNSIGTSNIIDGAITTPKIADGAVDMDKLAEDVLIPQPTDAQVTSAVNTWLAAHPEATTTVQDGAVTTAKIADGAVTDAKLTQNSGVLTDVAKLISDNYVITDNFIDFTFDAEKWMQGKHPSDTSVFSIYYNTPLQVSDGDAVHGSIPMVTLANSGNISMRVNAFNSSNEFVERVIIAYRGVDTTPAYTVPSGVTYVYIELTTNDATKPITPADIIALNKTMYAGPSVMTMAGIYPKYVPITEILDDAVVVSGTGKFVKVANSRSGDKAYVTLSESGTVYIASKNLFWCNNSGRTNNGITFSVDASTKAVTCSGTATASAWLNPASTASQVFIPNGDYVLSGGTPDIQIQIQNVYINGSIVSTPLCNGNPVRFTVSADSYANMEVFVAKNTSFAQGTTIYPQLELDEYTEWQAPTRQTVSATDGVSKEVTLSAGTNYIFSETQFNYECPYDAKSNDAALADMVSIISPYELTPNWRDKVSPLQTSIRNQFTFAVQTDTHYYAGLDDSGKNIAALSNHVGFDFICNLGDILRGGYVAGSKNLDEIGAARSNLSDLAYRYTHYAKCPVLFAFGNHDDNPMWAVNEGDDYIEMPEVYGRLFSFSRNTMPNSVWPGRNLYYYNDFGDVRVIVLNTTDTTYTQGSQEMAPRYVIGDEQLSWLTNQALDTEKAVIVLSHCPLDATLAIDGSATGTNYAAALSAIDAFKTNGGTVLGMFCGHTHAQNGTVRNGIPEVVFANGGSFCEVVTIDFATKTVTSTVVGNNSLTQVRTWQYT